MQKLVTSCFAMDNKQDGLGTDPITALFGIQDESIPAFKKTTLIHPDLLDMSVLVALSLWGSPDSRQHFWNFRMQRAVLR